MKKTAPASKIEEKSISEIINAVPSGSKMEIPLQQMFDEIIVFISKTDFD